MRSFLKLQDDPASGASRFREDYHAVSFVREARFDSESKLPKKPPNKILQEISNVFDRLLMSG